MSEDEQVALEIERLSKEVLDVIDVELFQCRVGCDVNRLRRLVTLITYHTSFEAMKAYIDAGLINELKMLAVIAGRKQRERHVEKKREASEG